MPQRERRPAPELCDGRNHPACEGCRVLADVDAATELRAMRRRALPRVATGVVTMRPQKLGGRYE